MRTTVWDILQLAWELYHHPNRKHLRIGQAILNLETLGCGKVYGLENQQLIAKLKYLRLGRQ